MSQSTRCAACKYLRRGCSEDCIFAPYFPPTDPQRFSSVHKIFGAANVAKMLQQLPVHLRAEAAESISYEANARIQDRVYGCPGIITRLQHQIIEAQQELTRVQGEIAYYSAQRQLQDLLKMEQSHADSKPTSAAAAAPKQESTLQTDPSSNPGFTNSMGGEFDGSIW